MKLSKKILIEEIKTLQRAAKIHAKYSIEQYKKVLRMLEQLELEKKNLDKKVAQRTKELKKEKEFIQSILDSSPNIVIVFRDNKKIKVNKTFLDFFSVSSLDEFYKKYECLCNYIIAIDGKKIKDKVFMEYFIQETKNKFEIDVEFNLHIYNFILTVTKNNVNNIIMILQDITEIKTKDKQLLEQSKLASMGEMIGNIAHQWRQPLSSISVSATGILLQLDFNMINEEKIRYACETINTNAQYLSKTIDDFRNFIKGKSVKKVFNLNEAINNFLNIIDASAKNNDIKIIKNIDKNLTIYGNENELNQCLINIFNNSKDAFNEKNVKNRLFFIDIYTKKDKIFIELKDNAGGIAENVINNIFEPYFTTKHKSQGTGLGLYMTYQLINKSFNGSITAINKKFIYDNQTYTGALFSIILPNTK